MLRVRSWSIVVVLCAALASIVAVALPAGAPSAAAASSIGLSRYTAASGDQVTVHGTGFAANDEIVITVDLRVAGSPRTISVAAQTNSSGAFAGTYQIPGGASEGVYPVTARDFHSHLATQNLTILPLAVVQVGKAAQTTDIVGNHSFYVSGSGFKAGEVVKLTIPFPLYNGNQVVVNKTVQTDRNGSFYETGVGIPGDAERATLTLTAVGQQSGRKAYARLALTYRPSLVLGSARVRPGESVVVNGRDFVPSSTVVVSLTFPRNGNTTVTLSRTVSASSAGSFSTSLPLPSDARLGTYTVSAVDNRSGIRATAQVVVAVHPAISVAPTAAYAGQTVVVTGSGYGNFENVSVSAAFSVAGGARRTVTVAAQTSGNGSFVARLPIPGNALPGTVYLTAATASGRTSTPLQVRPTPTPRPTATPTATPTFIPTPTATPTLIVPKPHHRAKLRFSFISVWYHTLRVGTSNHIVVRAAPKRTHAIWVHVWFPNGRHLDFFQTTSNKGYWSVTFKVPRGVLTRTSNTVTITLRLWQGKHSVRTFREFTLVS